MPTYLQPPSNGRYISSEANGTRSREVITLKTGHHWSGTVLGKLTASDEYVQLNPAANPADGSEKAAAVLYAEVDASSAPQPAVITARDTEAVAHALIWPDGITTEQKTTALAQLAALGIVAR